ncbi:hypothetical protein D3C84_366190 [compost metagenome]
MGQLVGPGIELGIAQGLPGKHQRRGVRCTPGLGFDQRVYAQRLRVRHLGGIPLLDHALLSDGIQQVQLTQGGIARTRQLLQQRVEVRAQLPDHRVGELPALVAVVQRQLIADIHRQGQRVVGLFVVVDVAKAQFARGALLQGLGYRVVLEHQDVVEQRFTAFAGPALDVEQRRVFVFAQAEVLRLHGLQPLADGLLRTRAGDDRQGVDEQADLLLDAFEFRRTPGHRGAERHGLLTGEAL